MRPNHVRVKEVRDAEDGVLARIAAAKFDQMYRPKFPKAADKLIGTAAEETSSTGIDYSSEVDVTNRT